MESLREALGGVATRRPGPHPPNPKSAAKSAITLTTHPRRPWFFTPPVVTALVTPILPAGVGAATQGLAVGLAWYGMAFMAALFGSLLWFLLLAHGVAALAVRGVVRWRRMRIILASALVAAASLVVLGLLVFFVVPQRTPQPLQLGAILNCALSGGYFGVIAGAALVFSAPQRVDTADSSTPSC